MTVENSVRKCRDDIERLRRDVERIKTGGAEDAKQHLAHLDSTLEHLLSDVRQLPEKLDSGVLEGLVAGWREGCDRLTAHARLIEAKSALKSAQRLGKDQYYVAAESVLTSVLRLVQESSALLPAEDAHVKELVQKTERAIKDIKEEGEAAAARLESIVATNERLLASLEHRASAVAGG